MKRFVFLVILMALSAALLASEKCPCTAVCTAPGDQILQHVVPDGAGGAVVAWQDPRNGTDHDIYAQRIDAYGNMLWTPNGICVCGAPLGIPGYQGHLSITRSGPDFIIAWEDERLMPGFTDIFAQKIDINGVAMWPLGGVPVCVDNMISQGLPQVCEDGAGGAFITWFDDRSAVAPDNDIYAEWINAAGVPAMPPTGMLVSASPWSVGTQQTNPVICSDAMGGAIIAYESTMANATGIYSQALTQFPAFALAWPAELPVCVTGANAFLPKIVNDQPGGAVVCWEDYRGGVGTDVFANCILNGAIAAGWPMNGACPTIVGSGAQYDPSIAACGANSAIIAWREGNLPNSDIMAQKIVGGSPVWPNIATPAPVAVCVAPGDQVWPQICPDGSNGVMMVWEDRRDVVTPSYDIYGEQVDTNGNILGAMPGSGTALCTFSGNQKSPMLANNQPNQAIYVWNDSRNSPVGATAWDLYTMDPTDPHVPVELSSFAATITTQNYVRLIWTTQSESQMIGYNVYRGESEDQALSQLIDHPLVPATNTSTTHTYDVTDTDVTQGTTYSYWLEAVDYVGSLFFGPVRVTLPGDVPPAVLPDVTSMGEAWPNPFKASANVEVSLKAGETGILTVYNLTGQIIRSYQVNEGIQTINWDGKDRSGRSCGCGVYFYKLVTPSFSGTRKMMLMQD